MSFFDSIKSGLSKVKDKIASFWRKEEPIIEDFLAKYLLNFLTAEQLNTLILKAEELGAQAITSLAKKTALVGVVTSFLPGAPTKLVNWVAESVVNISAEALTAFLKSKELPKA